MSVTRNGVAVGANAGRRGRWEAALEWLVPLLEQGDLSAEQQTLTNGATSPGENEQALSWLLKGLSAGSAAVHGVRQPGAAGRPLA